MLISLMLLFFIRNFENGFNGHFEEACDLEREMDGGRVVPLLDRDHRLAGNADRIREFFLRDTFARPQFVHFVYNGFFHTTD